MRKFIVPVVAAVLVFAANGPAQLLSLTTSTLGGNGQKGCMFDIVNISAAAVTIASFDQCFLAAGTATVEVWYRTGGGTYVGSEAVSGNWTLAGTAANLTHVGPGILVPVPATVGVTIPPGTTQGFYVTCTNATASNVSYTTAAVGSLGTVAAFDSFIQVLVGVGNAYPFSTVFTPRLWNGTVFYQPSGAQNQFETNDPASSLDVDGVQGTAFSRASLTRCTNATVTANFASTRIGLPWEVAIGTVALVTPTGGAFVSAAGQIVNIPSADPGLVYLFGGAVHAPQPFTGNWSPPVFTGPNARIVTGQQLNYDPAHPDGSALSQPIEMNVIAGATSVPGPLGDDTSVTIQLGPPPLCGPAGVPFFGVTYTQMQVISNGRVMFGTANLSFSPTVAQALTDSPFAGAWCDLNPATGGTITVSAPNSVTVRVDWLGVPYFAAPGTANTFGIMIDSGGTVTLDGLLGFQSSTQQQFLGISAGNTGATDPGATSFSLGGINPGPAGLGMLYQFGSAGTLASGVNILTFFPNILGNYDWFGA